MTSLLPIPVTNSIPVLRGAEGIDRSVERDTIRTPTTASEKESDRSSDRERARQRAERREASAADERKRAEKGTRPRKEHSCKCEFQLLLINANTAATAVQKPTVGSGEDSNHIASFVQTISHGDQQKQSNKNSDAQPKLPGINGAVLTEGQSNAEQPSLPLLKTKSATSSSTNFVPLTKSAVGSRPAIATLDSDVQNSGHVPEVNDSPEHVSAHTNVHRLISPSAAASTVDAGDASQGAPVHSLERILEGLKDGSIPFQIEALRTSPADQARAEGLRLAREGNLNIRAIPGANEGHHSVFNRHHGGSNFGDSSSSPQLWNNLRSSPRLPEKSEVSFARLADAVGRDIGRIVSMNGRGATGRPSAINPAIAADPLRAMSAMIPNSIQFDRPSPTSDGRQTTDAKVPSTDDAAAPASFNKVIVGPAGNSIGESVTAELRQPLSAQVSRAIYEYVHKQHRTDPSSMTMRLDPPDLGELVIQMSRTEQGLNIRVTALEPVTMDMLQARGSEIEQQLRNSEMGLCSLDFLSADTNGHHGRGHHPHGDGHPDSHRGISRTGRRAVRNASESDRSVSARDHRSGENDRLSFRA
ncbi:MAG: flagellar hook-length control protein FliK [Planctomycetaceae bacterium]|nr:flagellar hook-length control protein FliK [Planctomycetaceae bacterium]